MAGSGGQAIAAGAGANPAAGGGSASGSADPGVISGKTYQTASTTSPLTPYNVVITRLGVCRPEKPSSCLMPTWPWLDSFVVAKLQ